MRLEWSALLCLAIMSLSLGTYLFFFGGGGGSACPSPQGRGRRGKHRHQLGETPLGASFVSFEKNGRLGSLGTSGDLDKQLACTASRKMRKNLDTKTRQPVLHRMSE